MNKPKMTVRGDEPFVFICYAHKDSESVYTDLEELDNYGIRFWYDEGIPAGTSWRAEIAAAIEGSEKFLFYVSEESLRSAHCIREVEFALDHNLDIVPVYLEDCGFPAELGLALNRVQALFRFSDERYPDHLIQALQRGTGMSTRSAGPTKRNWNRLVFVLASIAASVLVLLAWQQWGVPRFNESDVSNQVAVSNVHERYLEGLKLMGRWDKGDNLKRAINLFNRAVEAEPGFALAYARLADAHRLNYVLTGDEAILELAETNANEAMRLNPDLATVQVAMGRMHISLGNFDLALAAVERALSIDPNDASANQTMAKLYERQGRLEDANRSFERAIALDPEDLVIRDSFANFVYRQGHYEEAAEIWQSVVDDAPDHFGALVNLGSALSEIGRESEAIEMYERAIEIRPSYMAYSNLGTAYFRAGHHREAVQAFQHALEIDDSDWLAWGNLAFTYSRMDGMGQLAAETFQHAIHLAEEARKQLPRDPYVHSDLGLYYANTAQTDLALQRVETALALSPDSSEILAAAIETLELTGQRDRAIGLARNYLDLGFSLQRLQRSPEGVDVLQDPRMADLL